MKFGYFNDSEREYVIETPKTPYPWINYLGNRDFFSLISNTSGGYSFYRDARLRRITRYRYNNVPLDTGGRYFYIKEGDTVWSPGWQPVKTDLDNYSCRHGLGYSIIRGKKNGLSAEALFFVPLDSSCEVEQLTLTNTSGETKSLKLFSFVEFCLWNGFDDMTNFQRNFSIGEVEIEGSVIYHKTEYRERRNHYAFYSVNQPIQGFDTDREQFLGLYGGFDSPDAVTAGKSRNSVAEGWSPIASHYFDMALDPGESRTLIFVLGYAENKEEEKWERSGIINKEKALKMVRLFDSDEKVERVLDELLAYWNSLLSDFSLQSGMVKLDRMVNIWNQYQCMVTFNMARSASYFESGIGRGIGFRDTCQDILGCVHQVPERAKERLVAVASTQFEDGDAYHQFQPLTGQGNADIGGNFNDDPLWLILGVSAYIKETGDFDFLQDQVPFDHDPAKGGSMFEHLKRSFFHVVNNLGPHGLPLIGRADWNDCLNLNCFSTDPNESYQTSKNKDGKTAESVLIAGMFAFIGREYVFLCRKLGLEDEAETAQGYIDRMIETIEKNGWDGRWYLRAYDDSGGKIGSWECEEGRIFIESQGFCSMAGIGAAKNMPMRALDSVKEHLDTKYGILLLQPAYSKYYVSLGEVSSYPPGYKENAGIFCHNNPWIMIGETVLGRGNEAFEYYKKICPAFLEEISDIHRTEPYIYAQMIAGKDASRHGEAKNSWLTGTAAWNFVAMSQYILGIRPEYDGLRVDPCIPDSWEEFTVVRRFRGCTYNIHVMNPGKVCKGIKSITLDGIQLDTNLLPVPVDGEEHQVEVILGNTY